jgi:hydroxyacyl-ACP dehydratase HTD2-like protein with hotdog domain
VACPRVLDWSPLPAGACSRIVTPDPKLLFRFSALTFNAHRIHYDRPYAINEEGYPGLVVHGPLTAVLLMEVLRQQVVAQPVREFSFRGLAPLFDLASFPPNQRHQILGRWQGTGFAFGEDAFGERAFFVVQVDDAFLDGALGDQTVDGDGP